MGLTDDEEKELTKAMLQLLDHVKTLETRSADLEAAIERLGYTILNGHFVFRDGTHSTIYLRPVGQ